ISKSSKPPLSTRVRSDFSRNSDLKKTSNFCNILNRNRIFFRRANANVLGPERKRNSGGSTQKRTPEPPKEGFRTIRSL
ncbi:hypothetical protein CH375_06795, partial [Leptospira ellisii]